MHTITVKLGKVDYQLLKELIEMIKDDCTENMTISEAIRWAIYEAWCDRKTGFPNDEDQCYKCTKEHYLTRNN